MNAAYPLSNPLPLSRPRPRILVGGAGPTRTLPLVAKYADAWNVITSPSRIDTHRDRFREQCERVGRSMDEIEITALDPEDLRREQDAAYRWSARWEVERLGAWRERGIEHVVLNIDPHDLGKLRAFGREVIAAVA